MMVTGMERRDGKRLILTLKFIVYDKNDCPESNYEIEIVFCMYNKFCVTAFLCVYTYVCTG